MSRRSEEHHACCSHGTNSALPCLLRPLVLLQWIAFHIHPLTPAGYPVWDFYQSWAWRVIRYCLCLWSEVHHPWRHFSSEDGASARVKVVRWSLSQGEGEPGCRATWEGASLSNSPSRVGFWIGPSPSCLGAYFALCNPFAMIKWRCQTSVLWIFWQWSLELVGSDYQSCRHSALLELKEIQLSINYGSLGKACKVPASPWGR